MAKNFVSKLKKYVQDGLLHIFSTNVINKIVSLLTNVVIVRIIPKADYGIFTYAYNIVTTIMVVSSIGIIPAQLQYGCEITDEKKRMQVEKTLFLIGLASNVLFSIGTFIYVTFVPLRVPESRSLLMILSFLPIPVYLYSVLNTELRIMRRNRSYARSTNIQTVSYFVFACLGGFMLSTVGTSIGRYLGYVPAIVFAAIIMRKSLKEYRKIDGERHIRPYLNYAFWAVMTNAAASLLYHLDVWVVGMVTTDSNTIASYKVATQIPTALAIIPVSIITYVYPKFVQHRDDPVWLKTRFRKMQFYMGCFNAVVAIVLVIFARFIVTLIYGNQYEDATLVFRMLMGSFFLSATFKALYGNVLAMLHKIKANFWISIVACVVNIVADWILIMYFGSVGAAIATITVVVVESVCTGLYFRHCLKVMKKQRSESDLQPQQ
ncbi:MAG: oligosaccharide flippase family protein [Clostridia bacterium]|nr:oligosaccharide flippase family protein [Clostridia bacterium]